MEGSDAVMNEWGVICVSNGTHTKEESIDRLRHRGDVLDNGINYMLRIELAKRAKTAREGIDTFARMIGQFGYGGSGTSFVIADRTEAWIFTAVMGKRWVAQRVPDDAVVLLPNVNIIQEIDLHDPSRFRASPDLVSYAVKKGWYDPKKGQPFNFRAAYDKSRCAGRFERRYHCDPRQWRGQCLVTGSRHSPAGRGPLALRGQAGPQAHGCGCPEDLERSPRRDRLRQDQRLLARLAPRPHDLVGRNDLQPGKPGNRRIPASGRDAPRNRLRLLADDGRRVLPAC